MWAISYGSSMIAFLVSVIRVELNDPVSNELMQTTLEINNVFGAFFLSDALPILKYFPTPGARKISDAADKEYDYMKRILEEHRKTFDPGQAFFSGFSTFGCS